MDSELLPLPVWPWPLSAERLELLKTAKERIETPIRVIPVEAAYGSPGRVLCFGVLPDFFCKTIPIRGENVASVDSIEAALRAWLDPWFPENQFAEEFWLGAMMGCDVRLIAEEDESGKVAFR